MTSVATASERGLSEPSVSSRRPRIVREHPGFKVREARERLTQGGHVKPEFEHEMMLMFVRNELSAVATIQLLAVIFSLASMFWATKTEAILWLALVIGAKARALWRGRTHASADDIRALAAPVLRHRLLLNYRAEADGVTVEDVIKKLLDHVRIP